MWVGVVVGESLLIVEKKVIWVGEDGGVLEEMGNEGMEKDGVMEGWGVNGRVLLVCVVFSLIERVFGGVIERMVIHL